MVINITDCLATVYDIEHSSNIFFNSLMCMDFITEYTYAYGFSFKNMYVYGPSHMGFQNTMPTPVLYFKHAVI